MSAGRKCVFRLSTVCMTAGLLCVFAAVGLIAYNMLDEKRASEALGNNVAQLSQLIGENKETEQGRVQDLIQDNASASVVPDYVLAPEYGMPTEEIDGYAYIGMISIPRFGTELPIISEWSYPALKVSPCRYSGSAYTEDIVLCGHNYTVHFGPIKNLSEGDAVVFTDVLGNEFRYTVAEVETLQPSDLKLAGSDGYALTMFSCTIGGQYRVTVRCTLDEG